MTNRGAPETNLIEDVTFILDECKRVAGMGRDVIKILPKEELFFSLPHPSGAGEMLCGRAAALRVAKLADEAGRRKGLSRRVSHQTLLKPTKFLLVRRFVTEQREVNKKQIDRFLASVGRQAASGCSDLTHFIPCTLMTAQEPDELEVGPVVFRSRANFRRRVSVPLRAYGSEKSDERFREHSRSLMATALAFYRQFGWVAEVTVKNSDGETSRAIAERTVTSALDCFHLIFRAQNTYKMRVGGPALRTDRRAGVIIAEDGMMYPHGSTAWAGQASFPDGWSTQLSDPILHNLLSLCGLALEAAVNPDLRRPISQRFLEAAQWFGEASRDERPATRVVKYVTALERMLMTDEKDDIAAAVSERVAALCCKPDASDRQQWREDANEVYDLRSRLLHGAMSPSDERVAKGARLAARLGEETILGALLALGEDALKAEQVSTKRLARWYGEIVANMDKINQPIDDSRKGS